jgi:uncharacterized protein
MRYRSSLAIRVPPVEECLHVMDRYGMMPNIRHHSLMVARIAVAVGRALNRQGSNLEIPLIVAGALLHDIAKTRSLREGSDHVEMGRRLVLELGYPAVARIVGGHVDSGPEIASAIDEATLVNYADKRVQHDKVVSLQKRFEDLEARYGGSPRKRSRIREMAKNMEKLENRIFSRLALSPEGLGLMVGDVPTDVLSEDLILEDQ